MSFTAPTAADLTSLAGVVLPIVLFVLKAKFPAGFAAVFAVLAKLIPVGPKVPAPTPAQPVVIPETGRPVIDGLLNVLLPILVRKWGAADATEAVALEIAAHQQPPVAAKPAG